VPVVSPAVRRPVSCQTTCVFKSRRERRVRPPSTHRYRDQSVGGRVVCVDPARPVAKLAVSIFSPAVRGPARRQATRVIPPRRQRRVSPAATHRHRDQPVGPARPVAKLAAVVPSPAVRRPARG